MQCSSARFCGLLERTNSSRRRMLSLQRRPRTREQKSVSNNSLFVVAVAGTAGCYTHSRFFPLGHALRPPQPELLCRHPVYPLPRWARYRGFSDGILRRSFSLQFRFGYVWNRYVIRSRPPDFGGESGALGARHRDEGGRSPHRSRATLDRGCQIATNL